jgi:hypothetical protein
MAQITAGTCHTVGLKSDGTVVAAGDNASGQCNVRDWTDITRVTAGMYHTVGLKSDGTMVAVGLETELARWNLAVPSSDGSLAASWPSIGEIAAVVAVALAILFLQRRRVARTTKFL